ncbi:MAG: hypothetical protein HND48_08305 [Chloroflexi bacterium]|nr:hypothetical protein [Chloroflexota bacterium]
MPTVDPYLYTIVVTLRDGRTIAEAEVIIESEIARLVAGDVSQAEVDKAKKQARASFAYTTETVTGQGYWLAFAGNLRVVRVVRGVHRPPRSRITG